MRGFILPSYIAPADLTIVLCTAYAWQEPRANGAIVCCVIVGQYLPCRLYSKRCPVYQYSVFHDKDTSAFEREKFFF